MAKNLGMLCSWPPAMAVCNVKHIIAIEMSENIKHITGGTYFGSLCVCMNKMCACMKKFRETFVS